VVQNPDNSVLWLSTMLQLIMIPVSLMTEVWPFCESLLTCKPFVLLEFIYVVLILLGILVGPAHRANVFRLYLFPEGFRLQQLGIAAASGMVIGFTEHLLGKPWPCSANRNQIAPTQQG